MQYGLGESRDRNMMNPAAKEFSDKVVQALYQYMHSEGPGGSTVLSAFMAEFAKLSSRSPADDPTNVKNHLPFIKSHITDTWNESLVVTEDGTISVGIGKDDVFGFDNDKSKLKHHPVPVAWLVYLIRGIAGRYAFISPETYQRMHKHAMPPQYYGGFMINEKTFIAEGWDIEVGSFDQYVHPASGAPPIPFFHNVLGTIDMRHLVDQAIKSAMESNNA